MLTQPQHDYRHVRQTGQNVSFPVQYTDGREHDAGYQQHVREIADEGLSMPEAVFLTDLRHDENRYGAPSTGYTRNGVSYELIRNGEQMRCLADQYSAEDVVELYVTFATHEDTQGLHPLDRQYLEQRLWTVETMDLVQKYSAGDVIEYHVAFEQQNQVDHLEDQTPCVYAETAWDDSQFAMDMEEVFDRTR